MKIVRSEKLSECRDGRGMETDDLDMMVVLGKSRCEIYRR